MKGTAPRGRWAAEDAEHAAALSASAKERAENIMVVDLLRNDMGRIAGNRQRGGSATVAGRAAPLGLATHVNRHREDTTRDRTRRRLRGLVPLRLGNRCPQDLGDGHHRRGRARPSRRVLRRGRVASTGPVRFETSRRLGRVSPSVFALP